MRVLIAYPCGKIILHAVDAEVNPGPAVEVVAIVLVTKNVIDNALTICYVIDQLIHSIAIGANIIIEFQILSIAQRLRVGKLGAVGLIARLLCIGLREVFLFILSIVKLVDGLEGPIRITLS